MRRTVVKWLIAGLAVVGVFVGSGLAKERLAFSEGPQGGTFQYFSSGIAVRPSKNLADVDASNMASAGSLENLRRVNYGEADFGIVYSRDVYLARNGKVRSPGRNGAGARPAC